MKLLFCVEFYYPSVGGAQEVMRQIAERMARRGHDVTVATTRIPARASKTHNGVKIVEFAVVGNRVGGMQGEVANYQEFLTLGDFDVMFIYAAQQWTFDAAWSVFTTIRARKVFVPCGYSGLFLDAFRQYFEELPTILKSMDALVYHAETYRDVDFAQKHGLTNGVTIPNGADRYEFDLPVNEDFRGSLGIGKDALLLLTVGSMTGMKGHLELVQAFEQADFGSRPAVLMLNGNKLLGAANHGSLLRRLYGMARQHGIWSALRRGIKTLLVSRGFIVARSSAIEEYQTRINRDQGATKKVLIVDLPRNQLIQAFLNADLFVFASNVEYSPLVLYEACAAGLPYLTVPVGNSEEIVRWTGGGVLCDAPVDAQGYTRVNPTQLARSIEALARNPEKRRQLGEQGKLASRQRYNWDSLCDEYECLFQRLLNA